MKYLTNNKKLVQEKTPIDIKKIHYENLYASIDLKEILIKQFSLSKNSMKDYLKNKKIIIVGPADYVNDNNLINSYDVIVRVNRGHNMINTNKHGNRTDILYHTGNQHTENGGPIPLDNTIKEIIFAYPVLDLYDESSFKNISTLRDYVKIYYDKNLYNKIKHKCSFIEEHKYLSYENKCDSRPNTGLCAILDLLSYDIKELYIIGFTLFQTNYDSSYRESVENSVNTSESALNRMKTHKFHDQYKSAEIYKNDIISNPKVKYDKQFIESIDKILYE